MASNAALLNPDWRRTDSAKAAASGFQYVPIWEVGRNFIYSYLCQPACRNVPQGNFAFDIEVIHEVNDRIDKLLIQEIPVRITAPVTYATLAGANGAERYMEECRRILKYMFGGVIFEIVHIPSVSARLPEILERISSYNLPLIIRVTPSFRDMESLAGKGVRSVGIDLRDDARAEKDIMKDLEDFAAGAENAGLGAHVYGLKTISLSTTAVTAGFTYVGSDAIVSSLEGMGMDTFQVKPMDLFKASIRG